jgi:hypothetical protein
MKKYLLFAIILLNWGMIAQQSVSTNGPTSVEVGIPYDYTFTFSPVYPTNSSGITADRYVITEWIVNTGNNDDSTSIPGYIGNSGNQSSYYNNSTFDGVNPLIIPIQWGDGGTASFDVVTVRVSGYYKKQNTGEIIAYFNYLENSLSISNVYRMKPPIINGATVIGSCGDQTISTFSFSNFTNANVIAWNVDGGASITGPSNGNAVNVIPPLSGSGYNLSCTLKRSSGNPLYKVISSKSVTRAAFNSSATISGPTGICTGTENYTISNVNVAAGESVQWSLTGNGTLSNLSNSGVTVNNISNNGLLQLNATIKNACNQTTTKTYTIFNGLTTFVSNASIQGTVTNMCTTSGPTIFNLNNVTASQSVVWSISNPNIANLDANGTQAILTPNGSGSGQQTLTATITNSCGQTATKRVSFYIGEPTFNKFTFGCTNRSLCITSDASFAFTSPSILNTKNRVIANFFGLSAAEAANSANWQWQEVSPNGYNLLFINNSSPKNYLDLCPIAAGTTTVQVRAKNNSCPDFSEWVSLEITIEQLPTSISFRQSQVTGNISLKAEPSNSLVTSNNLQSSWASENIWVRNNQDGSTVHQNPVYNESNPNYVYVRIANTGCTTSPPRGLRTYWAKSSTSLRWPNTWDGATFNGSDTKLGELIGEAQIPELLPEQETIISMPFQVPNPDKYKNIVDEPWTFGLLAKVDTESEETESTDTEDFIENLMNNDKIALKNVTLVDVTSNNPEEQTIGGVIAVGNSFNSPKSFYLELIKEDLETGKPIYDEAEVSLKLDEILYQAWVRGGKTAERIDNTLDEKVKLIKDNNVFLRDLELNPFETGTLYLKFNFLTKEITDKARYVYHIIQRETSTGRIIGGQTYVIKKEQKPLFVADAGGTKYVDKNEPITITAEQINDAAAYNWYDENGTLIASSREINIATEIAQKFKLEVIRTDGFKDYTEVEVKLNPNALYAISPNPASDIATVSYKINEASSAYLMVIGSYGTTGDSNNYIVDINASEVNINLSNYPNGFYTVALICDGQIVDAKILYKM